MIAVKRFTKPVSYLQGILLQNHLRNRKLAHPSRPDILLLLQHPPTYTTGRRSRLEDQADHQKEAERLWALGAEYHQTMRGGQTTFHGPGQLVGYPLLDLKSLHIGVRQYVDDLQYTLINVCEKYNIKAHCSKHLTGVWIDDGKRKIGMIGVSVSRHLTAHGFSFNCDVDLSCLGGIVGKTVTSLAKELNIKHFDHDKVCNVVSKEFGLVFGREMILLADVDPAIDIEINDLIASRGICGIKGDGIKIS